MSLLCHCILGFISVFYLLSAILHLETHFTYGLNTLIHCGLVLDV